VLDRHRVAGMADRSKAAEEDHRAGVIRDAGDHLRCDPEAFQSGRERVRDTAAIRRDEDPLDIENRGKREPGRIARSDPDEEPANRCSGCRGCDVPGGFVPHGCSRRDRDSVSRIRFAEVLHDLAECPHARHATRVDGWERGLAVANGREDLDALDRVDPQVTLEVLRQLDHLDRVAGLLGDDGEHQVNQVCGGRGRDGETRRA
jgi:hypothetical protein